MMKRICCLVLLLLPLRMFAQGWIDGIGFIDFGLRHPHQQQQIDLYTSPKGEISACLSRGTHCPHFCTVIIDNQGNWEKIHKGNSKLIFFGWGRYYGGSLQYYENKNGFARIKINDKDYWINIDKLADVGGSVVSWTTYFPNIDLNQMEVLYTMNLRAAPTTNSDRVMIVRRIGEVRGFHLVEMTGNFEGNWAEVKVHVWEKHENYCDIDTRESTSYIMRGWIKYLDDEGFPNLFPIDVRCG